MTGKRVLFRETVSDLPNKNDDRDDDDIAVQRLERTSCGWKDRSMRCCLYCFCIIMRGMLTVAAFCNDQEQEEEPEEEEQKRKLSLATELSDRCLNTVHRFCFRLDR